MLRKPVVVFLLYHGKGHFNACFKPARILSQTHRVIFAGVEFFKDHVVNQGIEYYPLKTVPFGTGLEQWMNTIEKKTNVYFRTVRDRFNDRLYKIREQELIKLIEIFRPDHILLDAQQSTDFIVLYPIIKGSAVKLSLVHTMLPTTLVDNVPPINCLALPGNIDEIQEGHKRFRKQKLKRKLIQGIKFFGMNDRAIVRRRIRMNKIPSSFISKRQSLFPFNLTQIPEFILVPKGFEYPDVSHSENQHYIGLQIDNDRIEIVDPEYISQSEAIYEQVRSSNLKLIYCSFGTVALADRPGVILFFRKLVDAINTKEYFLLISFPLTSEEKKVLAGDKENIRCFNTVPQLEVLLKTDLFVSHGGLNSVKESIDAGVPMLVYPTDSYYDQKGNSGRVVYHKLGLRGDILLDTVNEISDKINSILTDSEYKERVIRLKATDNNHDLGDLSVYIYS